MIESPVTSFSSPSPTKVQFSFSASALGLRRALGLRARHRQQRGSAMNWIDPAYCDVRLGFEVTAYVFVR